MPDIPIDKNSQIGRPASHVANNHTHLAFGIIQYHFG
jgi:hypothetical protein